jgi:hypothetical protein
MAGRMTPWATSPRLATAIASVGMVEIGVHVLVDHPADHPPPAAVTHRAYYVESDSS